MATAANYRQKNGEKNGLRQGNLKTHFSPEMSHPSSLQPAKLRICLLQKQPLMRKKICYIAHPIGGNVELNLASIRNIIFRINTEKKFGDVVPFAPYYADVVSCDDNVPELRERGLQNDEAILSRKGLVDELWLFGPHISAGMKREIMAAFRAGIPVVPQQRNLMEPLLKIKSEYEAIHN
jgi:hypothetical protein